MITHEPEVTTAEIGELLARMVDPDSTLEMRILFDGKSATVRHYPASQTQQMARDAVRQGKGAKGTYWLMNPLPADWKGGTAKDCDIVRRRCLLIDFDPKRSGTVSSTDQEKESAYEKAFEVGAVLQDRGWPAPVVCDSGNGYHLLFRIDLPTTDGGLVTNCLRALDQRFSDNAVDIDTKVGNASRITKLYGTWTAKGEDTPERPHRFSKIVAMPEVLEVVPESLLQQLAGEYDQPQLLPVSEPQCRRESHRSAIDRATLYLGKMDASVSGSHGHVALLKAASVLVNDFELSDTEAFDLLMSEFNPRCSPPWGEAEIRRKLGEGRKNPTGRPSKVESSYDRPRGQRSDGHSAEDESETTHIVDEPWPTPPCEAAFHGVAGDIVRLIKPHSEADPVALLLQLLVVMGNIPGRHRFSQVESTRHYANLFGVLVGSSSTGRKGTAGDHIMRLIQQVDSVWAADRKISGLVSGEGVTWNVRDPIEASPGVKPDDGITDKRLMAYESEFSSVLKCKSRDSNTLGEVLRQAWDSGNLRISSKNSPARATHAHISVMGHITGEELRDNLLGVDKANGLANRFLWCCVRRSKLLPDGGQIQSVDFSREVFILAEVVEFASRDGEIVRDRAASEEWRRLYPTLTRERFGADGPMCNRAAAQVVRLSLLYAILDRSEMIQIEHLRAAYSLWEYCERSVAYIFGTGLTDRTSNTIWTALKSAGSDGLSRTGISLLFTGNKSKPELDRALQLLHSARLARREKVVTGGRPVEVWYVTESVSDPTK